MIVQRFEEETTRVFDVEDILEFITVELTRIYEYTLFSLNFASTKFRDFRDFEKIAKFNTRELKDTRKLKSQNLVLISAVVSGETKLLPEDPFSDVEVEYGPAYHVWQNMIRTKFIRA